jgi:hypothetical protein
MQQLVGNCTLATVKHNRNRKEITMDKGQVDGHETTHANRGADKGPKPHLVEVNVDRHPRKVQAGPYRVAVFKHEVGVPPEKELDQIIKGAITPLDDNATIVIAGGEKFVSHERTGAAS